MAAEAGYDEAQHNMGVLYELGQGVEQSYETAFQWLTLAAEQGYTPSQVAVGNYYREGWGVEQSYEQAAYWYKRAADLGNEDGANRLQDLYDRGLISK